MQINTLPGPGFGAKHRPSPHGAGQKSGRRERGRNENVLHLMCPETESLGGSKRQEHWCKEVQREGEPLTWGRRPGGSSHAQRSRNPEAWTLERRPCVLFLPQTRTMFPFEMAGSTAVRKIPWYLETNDPSQAVRTGPFWSQARGVTDGGPDSMLRPIHHRRSGGFPRGPGLSDNTVYFRTRL